MNDENTKYHIAQYIHALVKINFVTEGYLPNYPYHMISDSEMCDAFMKNEKGYFYDRYPCEATELSKEYDNLTRAIRYYLHELKASKENSYMMPDWIYGYMLGKVVGKYSSSLDIHDLINSMNVDNIDDIFTSDASKACYQVSKTWLRKTMSNTVEDQYVMFEGLETDLRPPTMFGEPHVIKSLRVHAASLR